jgi:hypothetical protein
MSNRYVIYPVGIGVHLKAKAIARAKKLAKDDPGEEYRVESVDTEKVVARFKFERGTARNPRVAVLKSTTGYKDRAGKFHPTETERKPVTAKRKPAARKNPTPGFPVGKFVKVDAVKLNRNGTIEVMRSKRPKR